MVVIQFILVVVRLYVVIVSCNLFVMLILCESSNTPAAASQTRYSLGSDLNLIAQLFHHR